MKRLLILLLVILSACSENMKMEMPESAAGEKITVTANIVGDNTRVSQVYDNNSVKVNWLESGESFAVIQEGGLLIQTFAQTVNSSDSPNVFEGTLPTDGTGSTYYAYYPASIANGVVNNFFTNQNGTLTQDMCVMKATSNGTSFQFEHQMSILKPTFKVGEESINSSIKSVRIYSNTIKNAEWARAAGEYVDIQATCSSLSDIYLYISTIVTASDANRSFEVLVTKNDETTYTGHLVVPSGQSLVMGKLYTPIISLTETSVYSSATSPSASISGSGTSGDPYLISTPGDMAWLMARTGSALTKSVAQEPEYYKLEKDFYIETDEENPWTLGMLTPFIGILDGAGHTISGTLVPAADVPYFGFIGINQGTIQNLNIKANVRGVSNYFNIGTLLKLGELPLNVSAVGTLVGVNLGTISNCTSSGNIISQSVNDLPDGGVVGVGGIAGLSIGNITNCVNNSNITGTDLITSGGNEAWTSTAGIVGAIASGTITDCSNYGIINAGYVTKGVSIASGILGMGLDMFSSIQISSCSNNGNIYGSTDDDNRESITAGIAGWLSGVLQPINGSKPSTSIEHCTNDGIITGGNGNNNSSTKTGGIAGMSFLVDISYCTNNGGIFAGNVELVNDNRVWTGGIVAYYSSKGNNEDNDILTTITECTNNAKITGATCADIVYIGGIAGELYGLSSIKNSNNFGYIDGNGSSDYVKNILTGGISGHNIGDYNEIKNCTNTGNIFAGNASNKLLSGGITGYINSFYSVGGEEFVGRICSCRNSGTITKGNYKEIYYGGMVGEIQNISDYNTKLKPFLCSTS